ncbi:MAG: restriction endonuclease [Bacteroidales bacterium]|nr:restriction endonuclease [Bacteroidales bacterium]
MSKRNIEYKNKWEWPLGIGILLSAIIIIKCVLNEDFYKGIREGTFVSKIAFVVFFIGICCLFGIVVINQKRKLFDLKEREAKHIKEVRNDYEKQLYSLKKDYDQQINSQKKISASLSNLLKSKKPFKEVAALKADFETCIYEKDEHYLRYKSHPAASAADKVKEIRNIYKESLFESKQMLYKYEFLLSIFPELKDSFEDDESLVHIKDQFSSLDDYNDNRDRTRDWLTDNEYRRLSVDERNQLALDRYKKREKSNWEIGVEYELYIGYLLREGKKPFDGRWHVVQFGEKKGVEDLGRDIIADRICPDGKRTVYVIQCKRWSQQKTVHENAICQLFGTTIEYKIKHRNLLLYDIVPVFVTTTDLSDMAKEFAKQLGVQVMKIPMGDYPMIKCNVNNGEKIYHLPFDQQYYRTDISREGEFYAMTVKEATAKGFRRAMRHFSI